MPGILEAYIPQQVAMPKVQWGTPDGEEMQAPPAMFIGVGGSGGQMVRMIRSRLLSQLGVIPDGVEMLVLDTDAAGVAGLANSGIIPIQQPINGTKRLAAMREAGQPLLDDWPEPFDPGDLGLGAKQARAAGRLALISLLVDQYSAFYNAFQRLGQAISADRPAPVVTILGSLSGGTGAGMALDLAIFAKCMMPQATIVGAFLSPDNFGDVTLGLGPTMIPANCYAALKEMEYFFQDLGKYRLDHIAETSDVLGTALAAPQLDPTNRGVFDVLYLVDSRDGRGHVVRGASPAVRREVVHGIVADHLTSEYVVYAKRWQAEDPTMRTTMNWMSAIVNHVPNRLPNDGSAELVSGLGLSCCVYPRERLVHYGVLRWAARTLDGSLVAGRPGFDAEAVAERFITEEGLKEDEGLDQLLNQLRIDAHDLDPASSAVCNAEASEYVIRPIEEVPGRLEDYLHQVARATTATEKRLDEKAKEIDARVRKALWARCERTCDPAEGGISGVVGLLSAFARRARSYRGLMQAENSDPGQGWAARLAQFGSPSRGGGGSIAQALARAEQASRTRTFWLFPDYDGTEEAVEGLMRLCGRNAGGYLHAHMERYARNKADQLYLGWSEYAESLRTAAISVRTSLEAWAGQLEAGANQVARGISQAEAATEYRHIQYALTGDDLATIYRHETGDNGASVAELPDACREGLLGTAVAALAAADMDRGLWGWVQEAPDKVTVTPMQADLLTGLERAVRERLHGLNDYDLSKLGPTPEATEAALRAWATKLAQEARELWSYSPDLMAGAGNYPSRGFLLVPETGPPWDAAVQAVMAAYPAGAPTAIPTGDRTTISLIVATHNVPVRALTNLERWRASYDRLIGLIAEARQEGKEKKIKMLKPPHLCAGWEELEVSWEARGDDAERLAFALGLVTPLPEGLGSNAPAGLSRTIIAHGLTNHGGHYYLNPYPDEALGGAIESKYLGQGLTNTWTGFSQLAGAEQLVMRWFKTEEPHCVRHDMAVLTDGMQENLRMIHTWAQRANADSKKLLQDVIRLVIGYADRTLNATLTLQ